MYIKNLTHGDDEEISFAAAALFLGGIYLGRFVALVWKSKSKDFHNGLLILLPLVMVACIFAAAFFAGSLLSHKALTYVSFLSLPVLIFSIALGMFIKIIRVRIEMQLREAHLSAAQSKTELQLLQSQLSPHFLFNTLNNIYGISITNPDKIPPLLLQLSDLLRYAVYDAKEMFVPLQEEVRYIRNYIDFEKMRIGDRLILTTDIEDIAHTTCKIAPMLLIIFVENAFKHAKNTNEAHIAVQISLKRWGDAILFAISNSFDNKKKDSGDVKDSGLGLQNVRKRLELLYPNGFDLKVAEAAHTYSVMLRLNMK